MTTPSDRVAELLAEMEDWVEGRRSWVNLGPHAPHTPDVIATMDAMEVVKRAAAAAAYGSLIGSGYWELNRDA